MKLKQYLSSFLSGSKGSIMLVACFWVIIVSIYKPWKKNQIVNDVISYYAYLPAGVIHRDLLFKFTYEDPQTYVHRFWPETAPNGNLVVKTTMGVAILYSPFFFIAHAAAPLMHAPRDGFSEPYQFFLLMSCLVYLLLGLVFLRKLLLLFFTEKVTAITILSVFFATNLLWYSSFNGLMSHGYLFMLTTLFIYLIIKWHRLPALKTAVFIGLTGGIITLIRPTMILAFLVFFLYDVYNKSSFANKSHLFRRKVGNLVVIAASFFLVLLPQLIYWKYVTGSWLFFSYIGERFYFDRPHILEGLFGFRHGWLIYTPVMFFVVLGLFRLKKELRSFFLPIIILFPLLVYVFFSWWAWWYGGGFGMRPFIDFYGLFALPMACFYKQLLEGGKRTIKIIVLTALGVFISLNIFQSWQFYKGFLHHDSMTKESYVSGFFATAYTDKWFEGLHEPDYGRARMGLREAYSEEEIKQIKASDVISFKGCNTLIVSCELFTTKELSCERGWISAWEKFSLVTVGENRYALRTTEGKYVTADPSVSFKLIGDKDLVGKQEIFELSYLGNSMIALKAYNNRYVMITGEKPFSLYATSEEITRAAEFRIFIN